MVTLWLSSVSLRAMFNYDRLAIQNLVLTSSEEEMKELSINMADWNTDIAVGIANNSERRMQRIPKEIGEIQLYMTEMSDFAYDAVARTTLSIEPCS